MRSDLFLFVGILVFLFVVWVATGGPSRPISFAGPYITPIAAPGVGGTGYGSLSEGPSASATPQQTESDLSRVQSDIVNLEKSIVSSTRFGTPSTYKGVVTIEHFTSGLGNEDPNKEYVAIRASSNAPAAGIDITGWRIESEAAGYSSPIPQGVNLYHSGNVNDIEDILLLPGQTAILTTGTSPIGYSFRENLCTGYLGQFQAFAPTLAKICPAPIDDFNRFYTGNQHSLDACEAYVRSIPRCTIALNPPANLSSDCYQFVNTLNYNSCVAVHEGDQGFFGNEWRVYFNRDETFFTHDHDTLKLLDTSGNTVDLLSY